MDKSKRQYIVELISIYIGVLILFAFMIVFEGAYGLLDKNITWIINIFIIVVLVKSIEWAKRVKQDDEYQKFVKEVTIALNYKTKCDDILNILKKHFLRLESKNRTYKDIILDLITLNFTNPIKYDEVDGATKNIKCEQDAYITFPCSDLIDVPDSKYEIVIPDWFVHPKCTDPKVIDLDYPENACTIKHYRPYAVTYLKSVDNINLRKLDISKVVIELLDYVGWKNSNDAPMIVQDTERGPVDQIFLFAAILIKFGLIDTDIENSQLKFKFNEKIDFCYVTNWIDEMVADSLKPGCDEKEKEENKEKKK